MKQALIMGCLALAACNPSTGLEPGGTSETLALTLRPKPSAITQSPWKEVVINVEHFDDIEPFFTQIGGFETLFKNETDLLLSAKGADSSFVRLRQIGTADPARPADSRAWDKGCYFSLMMRAKNLPSIIQDAKALGWTPLTEMAYLEFGPSKLNIVVLTHESGVRVQLYERLTTPLPEGFTPFDRISRPFNIMQMVEDRDAGYNFFQQKLGFDTFFYGKPYISQEEEVMPLGIPPNLTTVIPYLTAIITPRTGLEYGRMEMIDIEGMEGGINYSHRCNADHTGIIKVRFDVPDIAAVRKNLKARDVNIFDSSAKRLSIKTPDGANIEFYQQ